MKKQQQQEWDCQFCLNTFKVVKAVRIIRYDTNNYENDKYAPACQEHLKYEV